MRTLGKICYSLDEDLKMKKLLTDMSGFLDHDKILLDDLPHLMRAYRQIEDVKTSESLEAFAIKKFLSLTPN